jgi:hypothetical protein
VDRPRAVLADPARRAQQRASLRNPGHPGNRAAGFVAELTYGENVNWLRNIEAAGECTVVYRGGRYQVTSIEPCDAEDGRAAYQQPFKLVLTVLRRSHFRLLRIGKPSSD